MKNAEISPIGETIQQLLSDDEPLVVAIDGRSGTGKSTLGRGIAEANGWAYVDQDDFYSGGDFEDWVSVSPEVRVDRCIDWRRVRSEVLEPLKARLRARYYPFNWETMEGVSSSAVTIEPVDVVILDGAYSTRTELLDLIDLTVLVTLDDDVRRQRIKEREGEDWTEDWFKVWDAAEELYFGTLRPPAAFDMVIARTPR